LDSGALLDGFRDALGTHWGVEEKDEKDETHVPWYRKIVEICKESVPATLATVIIDKSALEVGQKVSGDEEGVERTGGDGETGGVHTCSPSHSY